jgi:hypothetical protein
MILKHSVYNLAEILKLIGKLRIKYRFTNSYRYNNVTYYGINRKKIEKMQLSVNPIAKII